MPEVHEGKALPSSELRPWPGTLNWCEPIWKLAAPLRNLYEEGKEIFLGLPAHNLLHVEEVVLTTMGRAARSFEAAVCLMKAGHQEAAMMVARSLLETKLHLAFLFKDPAHTESLAERMRWYGEYAVLEKLLRPASVSSLRSRGRISDETIQELKTQAHQLKEKYDFHPYHWWPKKWGGVELGSLRKLAQWTNLEDDYEIVYAHLSAYSHASPEILDEVYDYSLEPGKVTINDLPHFRDVDFVFHVTTEFLGHILRCWSETLGLGIGHKIGAVMDELRKIPIPLPGRPATGKDGPS